MSPDQLASHDQKLADLDPNCFLKTGYMSRYEISDNVVCATSKASDQPTHTRSLIRALLVA